MSEQPKTEGQNGTTQPEGNGAAGKTFTQEEVNRIVSDRLARDRASRAQSGSETAQDKTGQEAEQQLQEREKGLAAREARLACREYLAEQKLPETLLDLFDASNVETFKGKCDKLFELFPEARPGASDRVPIAVRGGTGGSAAYSDKIAEAFRPPY